MALVHVVLFAALCSSALATVVKFSPCARITTDNCQVSEVRITPCTGSICALKAGKEASLSFDFTPNFTATKLKTVPYYQGIAYSGFGDDNACLFTSCPTAPGLKQTMNYVMKIEKKTPKGSHTFQWKVWNEEDESQLCCFETTIKIR